MVHVLYHYWRAIFVGSQAWEWATFIQGDYGAYQTKGGNILQFGDKTLMVTSLKRVAVEDFTTASHTDACNMKIKTDFGLSMKAPYQHFL